LLYGIDYCEENVEEKWRVVQKNVGDEKVLKIVSGKEEMGSGYNYPNELLIENMQRHSICQLGKYCIFSSIFKNHIIYNKEEKINKK